jgi:hypothetical protein
MNLDKVFDALIQVEELINAFSKEMPNECLEREAYLLYLKGSYYAMIKTPDSERAYETNSCTLTNKSFLLKWNKKNTKGKKKEKMLL